MSRLGTSGERKAELYLKGKGYRILEKNFRCRLGEIDLIALKKKTVVFCEVKTRKSKEYGEPFEAVTRAKQERLRLIAQSYLQRSKKLDCDYRFDVISILMAAQGRIEKLVHIKNAF